jgi:hypothetical protein
MPYPYLVQIAWDVVNNFILDWQKQPYRWGIEREIQAEIYSRLSNAYNLIGKGAIKGNYKGAIKGYEHNQIWNRVACESKINYKYKDGKTYHCFPDLIVWDEIENSDSPPKENENWPMLWLCEIKANSSNRVIGSDKDWDVEKLEYLLTQNYVRHALWLNFFHQRSKKKKAINWSKPLKDRELWVCTVNLPRNT